VYCRYCVLQVLTHGYLLSHRNVKEFIKDISWELTKFENGVANYLNSLIAEVINDMVAYRCRFSNSC